MAKKKTTLTAVPGMFEDDDENHSKFRAAIGELLKDIPQDQYPEILEDCRQIADKGKAESIMRIRAAEKASPIHQKIRKNKIRSERAGKIRLV